MMFDRIRRLLQPRDAELALPAAASTVERGRQDVEAAIVLGHAHWKSGRVEEAASQLETALSIDSRSIDANYLYALILQESGDLPGAIAHYERLIEIDPGIGDSYVPLFKAYVRLGRPEEAKRIGELGLKWCWRAVQDSSGNAGLLNSCGLVLRDLKLPTEALTFFDRSLDAQPEVAAALNNRGLVLHELDRFEDALENFDCAVRSDSGLADIHINRGNTLRELLRHDEALLSYERGQSIAIREDAFLNESLSRLVLGELPAGWERYEWRWRAVGQTHPRDQFAAPLWLGSDDIEGKTIFLYAEQGLGDTIQFCRYVKLVSDRGATVVLGVQPSLMPVLEGIEGVDRIIPLRPDVAVPACDYHCPLLSLPFAFQTSLETIPSGRGYVRPAGTAFAALLETWQARLGIRDLLRVGVVWSGNPDHTNDRNRSIPLIDFVQILSRPVKFIALQTQVRATDVSVLQEHKELEYMGAELIDFGQTAALITQLDLVLSVDTSVAHLAAAMGKPVWLLLPFNPDWRWLLQRDDSPWYETVRLFRQSRKGDWSDVLSRVGQEIDKLASAAAMEASRSRDLP